MYISVDKYQAAYEKRGNGKKLKTIIGSLSLPKYIHIFGTLFKKSTKHKTCVSPSNLNATTVCYQV